MVISVGKGWIKKAPKKSKKGTLKALELEIKAVEEAIENKLKAGDNRGINALLKKLSKLKKEKYALEKFRM